MTRRSRKPLVSEGTGVRISSSLPRRLSYQLKRLLIARRTAFDTEKTDGTRK